MRIMARTFFLVIFGAYALLGGQDISREQYATVSLKILDSYGHQRPGCHVTKFRRKKTQGGADYQGSFSGLVGSKIPSGFGLTYDVLVYCTDGSHASNPFVAVTRSEEFIVLVGWVPDGDYVTGPDPRLKIKVDADSAANIADHAWIKAVGVYMDDSEVAQIDSQSHSAGLFSIVPGRYLILLLNGEKVICTQQINFR